MPKPEGHEQKANSQMEKCSVGVLSSRLKELYEKRPVSSPWAKTKPWSTAAPLCPDPGSLCVLY